MSFDLDKHPFFEPWTDPLSGVVSFLLSQKVAPVQQSFYFTNSSLSADERWLWFYCAHPPNPMRSLGAVCLDPDQPEIHWFPETGFDDVSPLVAPDGDSAYFASGTSVWQKTIGQPPRCVCTLGNEYVNNRQLDHLATHLTLSSDGRYLLLDGRVGNHWFVGLGDIETGEVRILKELDRRYNHAQFSPVDPELFMIAQDWMFDPITGRNTTFEQRTWLMDTGQTRFEPLVPGLWFNHNGQPCHEWWSADGLACWTDYEAGVFECGVTPDPADRQPVSVWPRALCHAHCDASRRFYCGDESPYRWDRKPCEVLFFDRSRGKETHIVTAMPAPPVPRNHYHLDPHPQISPQGTFVVYTTTVNGQVDVALTPVEAIVAGL